METLRLLRWGPWITLIVICGTTVSSAHADQKSTVANAKARVDAARKVYQGMTGRLQVDPHFQLEPEKLYLWSWRWMDAQRMVSDKKQDQIAAIKAHLERMNEIEKWLKKSSDAGSVPPYSVHEAEFYRLEAEKWLSEAKTK